MEENNQSREPQIQWIKVLAMEKGHGIDLSESNALIVVPEEATSLAAGDEVQMLSLGGTP